MLTGTVTCPLFVPTALALALAQAPLPPSVLLQQRAQGAPPTSRPYPSSPRLLPAPEICLQATQDTSLAPAASRTKPSPWLGAHTALQLPMCSAPWARRASLGCQAPADMGGPSFLGILSRLSQRLGS